MKNKKEILETRSPKAKPSNPAFLLFYVSIFFIYSSLASASIDSGCACHLVTYNCITIDIGSGEIESDDGSPLRISDEGSYDRNRPELGDTPQEDKPKERPPLLPEPTLQIIPVTEIPTEKKPIPLPSIPSIINWPTPAQPKKPLLN